MTNGLLRAICFHFTENFRSLNKRFPPASSLPLPPSSFNGICMMLREGLGPDPWPREQCGSWEITFAGTPGISQPEAMSW